MGTCICRMVCTRKCGAQYTQNVTFFFNALNGMASILPPKHNIICPELFDPFFWGGGEWVGINNNE